MLGIAAGGGLAGAAFAIEIARGGGRAMIIEKTAGPHHKVCGEFLSGNALVLLRGLGVDVHALGGSHVTRLGLADRATRATADLPFEASGLSRFRLDEALLQAAQAAGVEVLRSTTVDGIGQEGTEGVTVQTSHGPLRADAVALASGKHNVRGLARPNGPMVGFKMHVRPSPATAHALDGAVQLVAMPGGYGGFCLIEDGLLSIAWNVRSDALGQIGVSWEAQSAHFAQASIVAADLLAGARPLWEKPLAVSGQPYGFLRSETLGPSIYPVGDQLAVIPSFTGDGTALALASGIAAAQAVMRGEDAVAFQRRMIRRHRVQFRLATALDVVIARPLMRRVALAVARQVPGLITTLVSATRLRGFDDVIAAARTAG